jgi:hypothetical protein
VNFWWKVFTFHTFEVEPQWTFRTHLQACRLQHIWTCALCECLTSSGRLHAVTPLTPRAHMHSHFDRNNLVVIGVAHSTGFDTHSIHQWLAGRWLGILHKNIKQWNFKPKMLVLPESVCVCVCVCVIWKVYLFYPFSTLPSVGAHEVLDDVKGIFAGEDITRRATHIHYFTDWVFSLGCPCLWVQR